MTRKEKVILRKVPEYHPLVIQNVVKEGLNEFGLIDKIQGRITIKPNVVIAHHKVAPSAYTRPEFLDAVLSSLDEAKSSETKITVAEKCGAGLPTSRMFRRAGYYKLKGNHRFKLSPIDESKKRKIPLRKGTVHKNITTSREMVDKDLLIYLPKLKTNSLTHGLTGAVKLNLGILRDKERMWNHNYKLDEKIADLLEVGYPDFIATDAVEISLGGNHMTQHGYPLGVVVMAKNPVAHDAVCARMLHLDPQKIHHLRIAHERGYGPLNLEDIEVEGDISLQEIQKKTEGWDRGVMRVEEVRCGIDVLCGEPYCNGGCHGILLDWLHMIKDRKPSLWGRLPHWTAVMGKYRGDVTAERLIILGTCSEIQGKVKARRKIRIKGCPPKHKDLVLWFFLKAGILNPLFRFDLIWDAYPCLFFSWCRRLIKGAL